MTCAARLRLMTLLPALSGAAITLAAVAQDADPIGPSMTLGAAAPAFDDRTVVLFDGTGWDGWVDRNGSPSAWEVQDDGSVLVKGGDALTSRQFGDFQLHLEFMCPSAPGRQGQAKSNSGVYLHGRYEVQVLDSFGQAPADNLCGGIYRLATPLVNASRPPDQWQTYDIIFRAPIPGTAGEAPVNARVTVLHNGVVIHNNVELPRPTPGGIDDSPARRGPVLLQDHGDPVRYRNIWVREL